MLESKNKTENVKVSQSSKCKRTRQKVSSYRNNGHGFMGSLNPLSPSMVMIKLSMIKVHTIVML